MSLPEQAAALRELHRPGTPLLLPNAWDVSSAALIAARFAAVATSSGAIARSLGRKDGQQAPVGEMLAVAARIAEAVDVPVTVDAEAGYGLAPAELVERLLEAGVAGCNLEDTDYARGGLADVQAQCDLLAGVVAAGAAAGVPLVVNARVDVFLRARSGDRAWTGDRAGGGDRAGTGAGAAAGGQAGSGDRAGAGAGTAAGGQAGSGGRAAAVHEAAVVDEAISRGLQYLAAGADCVYPIMAAGEDVIGRLVDGLGGRVNVMYRPGAPSLARLAELGVARISFGSGLHAAMCSWLGRTLDQLAAGAPPY
jgi:2-methylisocitrate lyase-like PEP mutase family enzyme